MEQKLEFNPAEYHRTRLIWLLLVILFSLVIDLLLYWLIILDPPAGARTGSERYTYWMVGALFLFFINTVILKIAPLWVYFRKMKKYRSGYIQITEDEVVHCLYHNTMKRWQARWINGYVRDENKKEYDDFEIYRIKKVDHVKINRSGDFQVSGLIEATIINEIVEEEMGPNFCGSPTRQIKKHNIPPYYDEMQLVKSKLESMSNE